MENLGGEKYLTVLIPFMNEVEEVAATVADVRRTAGAGVDILVLNDCSTDGYDYKADLGQYDVQYVCNSENLGSAPSRDLCVNLCRTPYFLFLDAHKRFFCTDWVRQIVSRLEESDRQLLCGQTLPLIKDDKGVDEVETLLKRWQEIESSKTSYSIIVLPTLDCNCRCWYCYEQHNAGTNMSPQMVEVVKKHIALKTTSPELKRFNLSFFGGEPLMGFCSVVMPLLRFAKDVCQKRSVGFGAHFTTNASLLTDEMISELKELSIPIGFQITLDGNRKSHDSIRCTKTGKPTFDTIVANVHKLLQNGFKVSLRINYTKANIDTNYDIIDEFKDLSDEMRKLLDVNFQQVWQDVSNNTAEGADLVRNIQDKFEKKQLCANSKDTNGYRCYADCENNVVINYNGDIYKCTARDFQPENREGVICADGHIEFNDVFKKRMLVKHTNTYCRRCMIFPICMGTCSQYCLENNDEEKCYHNYSAKDKETCIISYMKKHLSC